MSLLWGGTEENIKVGSVEASRRDTACFQQAARELKPAGASLSEMLRRAEELKSSQK
jgi:hypothetical protein